jgi:hypothetical protein
MRDLEATYQFILEYYELCMKYGVAMKKCACEECSEVVPSDICTCEDCCDELYEDLMEWYVTMRRDIELTN